MPFRMMVTATFLAALRFQDPVPEAAVKSAAEGVVILLGKADGKETAGTGVIIRRAGNRALVLAGRQIAAAATDGSLEAVLAGPGGTPRRVPAKVLFTDTVTDIAMVSLEAADLPAPLKLDPQVDSHSTETLFLVGASSASETGHTQVEMNAKHKAANGMSWGSSSTARLDRSWDGAVALNSRGVAIGFFRSDHRSGRSLILLVGSLKEYLGAFPMAGSWAEKEIKPGEIKGTYRCHLSDPESRVKAASLVVTRQDLVQRPAAQNDDGTWSGAIGSPQETFSLTVKDGEAVGEFTVRYALPEDSAFVTQVRVERGSGTIFGPPEIYLAPFSKTKGGMKKGDDWIGGKGGPGKGAGVETATPLARPKRAVEDVTIVDLDVVTLSTGYSASSCLSESGDHLYLVGAPNFLRKIRTSDFVEERRLVLPFDDGGKFIGLALTRAGLVILGGSPCELLVIDEGSLTIRRRVFICEKRGDPRQKGAQTGMPYWQAHGMAASPALARVFVTVERDMGGQMELVVDAGAGKIVNDFVLKDVAAKAWESAKKHAEAPRLSGTSLLRARITSDGRCLVASSQGSLQRYRVSGSDVILEEVGPSLGQHMAQASVSLSPDGRYVTLVHPSGHQPPRDHPALSKVNYIYKVSDLQKPWSVLRFPKESPGNVVPTERLLAFDREARQLYVTDASNLVIFDSMGQMTRQLRIFDANSRPGNLLMHPDGLKLAVTSTMGVHWVELPPPK